jgi:hypothetical protein
MRVQVLLDLARQRLVGGAGSSWKREVLMTELGNPNHEQKVFLAGCPRAIILADGALNPSELDDLERIYNRLGFNDYDACLDESEGRIKDEGAFLREAERIADPAAQDATIGVAYEQSLRNGALE